MWTSPKKNLTRGKGNGRKGQKFLGSKFPEARGISTVYDPDALSSPGSSHGLVISIPKLASRQRWSEEQKGLGKPLAAQRISSDSRERRPRSLSVPSGYSLWSGEPVKSSECAVWWRPCLQFSTTRVGLKLGSFRACWRAYIKAQYDNVFRFPQRNWKFRVSRENLIFTEK